ncbi:hypothetical protein TNCV_1567421 [Trichonephila clavipes]|nr:hypothetical protein TNCV_1567421 [Trichonephila clavipes]
MTVKRSFCSLHQQPIREQALNSPPCQISQQLFCPDEGSKPRLPDPINSTNHRHATQQNAKLHFRYAQHRRLPDMGLMTVLQSGCPKSNAYSTPIFYRL